MHYKQEESSSAAKPGMDSAFPLSTNPAAKMKRDYQSQRPLWPNNGKGCNQKERIYLTTGLNQRWHTPTSPLASAELEIGSLPASACHDAWSGGDLWTIGLSQGYPIHQCLPKQHGAPRAPPLKTFMEHPTSAWTYLPQLKTGTEGKRKPEK